MNKLKIFSLLVIVVVLLGVGCKNNIPKQIDRPNPILDNDIKQQFGSEISSAVSSSSNSQIIVGVSLNKISGIELLDKFCLIQNISVVGVIYNIPGVIGERTAFSIKKGEVCSVVLSEHAMNAIPSELRKEYKEINSTNVKSKILIDGLFLKGKPSDLLSIWEIYSEIRAMRLSPDNLSVDVPTPDQPLSKFYKRLDNNR